jgi:hypothetical protein
VTEQRLREFEKARIEHSLFRFRTFSGEGDEFFENRSDLVLGVLDCHVSAPTSAINVWDRTHPKYDV